MYLKRVFSDLVNVGTNGTTDLSEQLRINKVNGVAAILVTLSILFGTLFYIISGYIIIPLATTIQSVLFSYVVYLNYRHRHDQAGITLLILLNISISFFATLLSDAVEPTWMFIFLVGMSFLILKAALIRRIGFVVSGITLFILEVNKNIHFIKPLSFTPDAMLIIHYSSIFVILFLTVLILYYHASHNEKLVNSLKKHSEALEKQIQYRQVFIRELNHELRAPLNAIYSISQLKLMEDPVSDQEKITNEHLFIACHNALGIINNSLDKNKMDAGQPDEVRKEAVALHEWLRNTISIYQYFASGKSVKVKLQIEPETPAYIYEDKVKLTKIINNLIVNAIKFTKKNSLVTLTASISDTLLRFSITDQGEGISKEKYEKIFTEFYRENIDFAEGTGLGLHIASRLAAQLQGQIRVSSQPGNGSTFSLTVPFEAPSHIPVTQPETLTIPAETGFTGRKIVFIEDDALSQRYISRYLNKIGFQVMVADDGLAGFELAASENPDIIITDMGLPTLSGKTMLQKLTTDPRTRQIPVIAASGDADMEAQQEALDAGASYYFIKPISFSQLNLAMQSLLQPALAEHN